MLVLRVRSLVLCLAAAALIATVCVFVRSCGHCH